MSAVHEKSGKGAKRHSPESGNAVDGYQKLALLQHMGDIPSSVGQIGHLEFHLFKLPMTALLGNRQAEQNLKRRQQQRVSRSGILTYKVGSPVLLK